MTMSPRRFSSDSDGAVSPDLGVSALSIRELLHQLAATEDALRDHQPWVTHPGATMSTPGRHPVLIRQQALIRELRARRLALRRWARSGHRGAQGNASTTKTEQPGQTMTID